MEIRESKEIEFIGCYSTDEYYKVLMSIMDDMKKSDAPYSGSFELEVSKDNGRLSTETKKSSGLSDPALRMFDQLEEIATSIAKGGKEPSKISTNIEIEKDV